ncbi:MAG: hypothetical protein AABX33_07305 [Nanoarchaeota archaeon]
MGFKNFLISIIKSLITLLIATLIFSTITFNFPDLIKAIFGDIFAYASPEAQKQIVSKLTESCSSLDKGENLVTINQICTNKSLLKSMRENCQNYEEFKMRGIKIENEEQVMQTCSKLGSGDVDKACSEMQGKSSLAPDLSSLGVLCKDYSAGKISDKEFFFSVISDTLPSQLEMPKIGVLEKYNRLTSYLNANKIIYFVVLLSLLTILYLLIMNIRLFSIVLTQVSFSIGILIMLPYFVLIIYDNFVGIDTTPILGSMFGAGNVFEPKAILSVILLMFLRTYTPNIIVIGILFLTIGIAGKIYSWRLKKQNKTAETKKSDKAFEVLGKEDKESPIEDRERKKSTKEILDELEEVQKKKTKRD